MLLALARASLRLQSHHVAFDAPLGDLQYVIKATGHQAIPISGANSFEGVFNMSETKHPSRSSSRFAIIDTGRELSGSPLTLLDEKGNSTETAAYRINYGSSFVMALQYTDAGPEAKMLLSYSQSHDPESSYFDDQTKMYSERQWRPIRFNAEEVRQNTLRRIYISSGRE